MKKEKLLISACLMGENCRYDGKNNRLLFLEKLQEFYELIPVCPEVEGGLSIPRLPCERVCGRVVNQDNEDVTTAFIKGAQHAVSLVQTHNIKKALFQERSPSCGVHWIYDGSFTQTLIKGQGVATEHLRSIGVFVYSNEEMDQLWKKEGASWNTM